jgi:hypothetical protein
MLENPFLPSPSAAAAWSEGFLKGLAAIASPQPGRDIYPDDYEAFNQGVAAGEEGARLGMEFSEPCLAASEEHGPLHGPGMVIDGAHIAHGLWELRHWEVIGRGLAGILVGLIELACTLPVHTLPPEDVLPGLAQPLLDSITSFGVDSMEFFCGAGLDPTAKDCEIMVSPLFVSVDQAREAAISMNRYQWVVVRWRTDQSNSFRVVEAG